MADPDLILSRARIDGVLFDLDGVVTHTAELQALAWKRLFDDFLGTHAAGPGENHGAFDAARDYRRYIDGRPREKGLKHFLLARGVDLPAGSADDGPDQDTLHGLGQRKNALFLDLLEEHGVEVYECSVALLRRLRRAGIRTAAVTASRHGDILLQRAGLDALFDARLDGNDAEREDLAGKPDPDTLLAAACRLGVAPSRAAVLDDTVAGVRAAARGRFGLVIGVDRGGQHQALTEHGAHLVFEDLCHIAVSEPADRAPPPLGDPRAHPLIAAPPTALFIADEALLPDPGHLDPALRPVLHRLVLAMPVTIVSARDTDELRRLIGLPRVIYAGGDGFDIQGPDLRLLLPEAEAAPDELEAAATALERTLAGVQGVRIERGDFAVIVDCAEAAAADLGRIEDAIERAAADRPRLRRSGSGRRLTLRPDIDWDRGQALHWLLAELGMEDEHARPMYIGAAAADEDAFRELPEGGIGILVADAPRPSAAHHWLPADPGAVALLQALPAPD